MQVDTIESSKRDQVMYEKRSRRSALASRLRVVRAASGRGVVLSMLVVTPTVLAAEFDPRMKAPSETSVSELRADVEEIFHYVEDRNVAMSTILRNGDQHAIVIDLKWRVGQAIDARKSLAGLEGVGIKARGDGSVEFDLERFPQWHPLEEKMMGAFDPDSRERTLESLRQRGFREADVLALREHLERNNPDLLVLEETVPLTESFAARTRKRAEAGRSLDEVEKSAYEYQLSKRSAEAIRAWAAGVLDVLDRQRQRILESYLTLEIHYRLSAFPSAMAADKKGLEDWLLSGEYVAVHEEGMRHAQGWTRNSEKRE